MSMTNLEKYNNTFISALGVNIDELTDLKYGDSYNWKSFAHMLLITAIEESFDIEFEPEDITQLTSYKEGRKLLKKFNINID